jgi:hypothetical protein
MQYKNGFVPASVKVVCVCKGHTLPARRNKNLIRFLESFVLLPVIAVSLPFGSLVGMAKTDADTTPVIALSQQQNIEAKGLLAYNQVMDQKALLESEVLKNQAAAIDAYFKKRGMPLYGMGMAFAKEAEKNDLDWRLLPAIAVRESTGGKHACKNVANSFFGWGGCKIGFKSKEEAIETVARNLGGNNPNTDHHYSKGKTTKQILEKYNPPSVIPHYAAQVIAIMNAIGDEDLGTAPLAVANT